MRCGDHISKKPTDIGTLFYDTAGDIMTHYGLNTFHQEPVEEAKSYPLLMHQNSDQKQRTYDSHINSNTCNICDFGLSACQPDNDSRYQDLDTKFDEDKKNKYANMIEQRAAFVGAMKIDSHNANNNSDINKSHVVSHAIIKALFGQIGDEMCHHKEREEYQDITGGHDARIQSTWENMPFDAPDGIVLDENDTLKALFNFADASLQRNMSMILHAIERDDREANTDKLLEVQQLFPKTSLDYFMEKSTTGSGKAYTMTMVENLRLLWVVGHQQNTE